MTASSAPLLLTVGYGKRSIAEMMALLRLHEIGYLIDVRSAPWSRYHPDFAHDALKARMHAHDLAYLYMGKELGGRPEDPDCYDAERRVDYTACRARPAFQQGIDRLCLALEQGRRLALLCAESKPELCHRSRLIGVALAEKGIEILHVDEDGSVVTQHDVMLRLSGGQLNLFADSPAPKATKSRGKYRPAGE